MALISVLYNFHFDSMFSDFQRHQLNAIMYTMIDDMQDHHIRAGPLDEEQRDWMVRRANLHGILVQYGSADRTTVWADTMSKFDEAEILQVSELPYIVDGETLGMLRVSLLGTNNELNPVMIEYRETMRERSNILYVLVILCSLVVSLRISKLLSRHLSRLQEQTNLVRMGKRDVMILVKGPEEVRQLAVTLREMVIELKKQEDWRQHLMEDLMHELRAPLTSMLSQIEAVIDGIYKADESRMNEIYEELERLSRLINDMERLSEAESAQFSLQLKRTDMVRLAKSAYENFLPLAKNKHLKFKFQSANVPVHMEVDRDKMVQVLSNIISNAIKYNRQGGSIWLSIEWNKDGTVIRCEDTGIGIGPEDLPYIFNRLYRADKSRSRFNSGVGIGLSIVKALVEAHNGKVSVESTLGKGSVFTVFLQGDVHAKYTTHIR